MGKLVESAEDGSRQGGKAQPRCTEAVQKILGMVAIPRN